MVYVDAIQTQLASGRPDSRTRGLPTHYCFLFADSRVELDTFLRRHALESGFSRTTYSELGLPHLAISATLRKSLLERGVVREVGLSEIDSLMSKYRLMRYSKEELEAMKLV